MPKARQAAHIALIGDYSPTVKAHEAITIALRLAAKKNRCIVEPHWIATPRLDQNAADLLSVFDGIWCVPASPYASMNGALNAIRFARENGRPFLGTCGGFQHALIEFARNVLGLGAADHTESNPKTTLPLISRLSCSLVESKNSIRLKRSSKLGQIYRKDEIEEAYHCNFGLNPAYESALQKCGLIISGRDQNNEVRAIELAGHPFFMATLFQPERSAFSGAAHPLIEAFVNAAISLKP